MALSAGTRIGPYEIQSPLGAGGMGEVYRARDARLARDVALKVLPDSVADDPDRLARFQREAQVLAALKHPNIGAIYGFEEAHLAYVGRVPPSTTTPGAGGPAVRVVRALVLELVEGDTLAERIAQGPIPVDEALAIAKQIADALEAAHEQGIIHRDLKPANIKITPEGVVKVLDFGLAKLTTPEDVGRVRRSGPAGADLLSQSPTLTSPALMTGVGVILGTAAYMAPEQARGKPADKRSDIWAFGCVLYEMLTGRAPFQGETIAEVIGAVMHKGIDWSALPAALPTGARLAVERCLTRDRAHRLSDIAVAQFLLTDAAVASIAADGVAGPSVRAAGRSRRAMGIALALAAVSLIGGAAVWSVRAPLPAARVSRLAFVVDGQFTGTARQLVAISPDGTNVVYAANGRLYLRPLNVLEARPIAGTDEDANGPFFSPDGQWVGFYSRRDGALKKIHLNGGSAVTLCQAELPFGASWEGDTIVFGQQRGGILAVPAGGGTPQPWARIAPDETADGPQLLPGGAAIVFAVTKSAGGTASRWDSAEIVVYSRETEERKTIIRGGAAPRYVPGGYILYATGATLMAVPFDIDRLEVTGQPVAVVDGVRRATASGIGAAGAANVALAADGTLTYVPGTEEGIASRELSWVDRGGREIPIEAPRASYAGARLSPDAQRIAVARLDEGNDIWVYDVGRGALTRQTYEMDQDETPAWSRDGQWLAYASVRGSERTIFRRRADGTGGEEPLWSAPAAEAHAHVEDWTSDGGSLLVSVVSNTTGSDLFVLPLSGPRTLKPLIATRFDEWVPRVSPDGHWLAYGSNESGRSEVYVQPFPSLQGKWQVSTGGGREPVWSKAGDELFYRGEGWLMAVPLSPGKSFSPGPPQRLFEDTAYYGLNNHVQYDVSPDARRFVMIKEGTPGTPQIVVVQNWTSELQRLVPTR